MEMINSNNFIEISENDMRAIDGGVWPQAVAIVTLLGATLVGAFSAGRVFVRDVRNKFFSKLIRSTKMISIENTQFTEINNSDLNLVNGGAIGVGMACLIIGAAVIKTAWYGFLAGCAYELILG